MGEDESKQAEDLLIEPKDALAAMALEDLPEAMRDGARRAGWTKLMPVQARAIPYMVAGRDLMVQSRTGSGKTGAFVLPILAKIDPNLRACQALVLVPTRELAVQVHGEANRLAGDGGVRTIAVYGGVGYGAQLDAFDKGAHLVVGTPGRLLDHLQRGSLRVDKLKMLVFDEADRLMSMGFFPDMRQIASKLPKPREGYMFSATFPEGVQKLARIFLNEPGFLSLSRDRVFVTETDHIFYSVPTMDKDRALIRIIEIENPDSAFIFCNRKVNVNFVTRVLQRFGYDADQLTSDLSQAARESVLNRIREKKLRFLVATDLAARGIDIDKLSHVIQYDFPDDPDSFVHRAGRTGRAGADGINMCLVSPAEKGQFIQAAKKHKLDMDERPTPTNEDVETIASQRATAMLETRRRGRTESQAERTQAKMALAHSLSETDEGLDLIAMLIDDFYQHELHTLQGDGASAPAPEDDAAEDISEDKAIELMETHRGRRDRLQVERMRRMKSLARSLSESEDEIDLIAMLIDDFSQHHLNAPPPKARRQPERVEPRPRRDEGRGRSGGGRGGGRSGPRSGGRPGGRRR